MTSSERLAAGAKKSLRNDFPHRHQHTPAMGAMEDIFCGQRCLARMTGMAAALGLAELRALLCGVFCARGSLCWR